MADIFISYARSTAPQAQRIAEALRALGYRVWRDDELPAHRSYAEVIEERLKAAKAVVVIWSAEGVKSEWVQSEADRARNDRKLVQLSVDGTPLPMPFDRIQCADLSGWNGDISAPGWRKVVASVADLAGVSSPAAAAVQNERTGVSICVLPFANMSNDAEQEYFSDGISEDIITDLSKVSALSVIARNSAFAFKGKHVDVKQVARQLEVSHVLEGSVRKSGNRVRITAQLINGATNDHVWAERYDRNLDDIFALQDEISQAIVAALKLKLFPAEKQAIADRGTTNIAAYDKYLRARALYNQLGRAEVMRSIAIFREALELDPEFARAWSGLYAVLNYARGPFPEIAAEARTQMAEARARVEALSPDAWWTHALRAEEYSAQRKWIEAEAALSAALATAPASETDWLASYGRFLCNVGRATQATQYYERALEKDPLSSGMSAILQAYLACAGRPEEAQAEYERSKDLPGGHAMAEHFALLRLMSSEGADPAAIKAQFAVVLQQENIAMPLNRVIAELLDKPEAALAATRQAFDDPANQHPSRMGQLALYTDYYGDKDLALAALRRSVVDLRSVTLYMLWRPTKTGLRADPRFKAIIRDLGIADYWSKSGNWGDFARPLGTDDFEIFR